MLRDLGQDILCNIAEYCIIPRNNDINALGIHDLHLIERIKLYDKNFHYGKWKEDIEKKKELLHLMGVRYQYVNILNDEDEYYCCNTVKPDENERILSIPSTLEEYLNRIITVTNMYFKKYVDQLTGNWIIDADWHNGHQMKIKTDNMEGMLDIIEIDHFEEDGYRYPMTYKSIEDDWVILMDSEYVTWFAIDLILLGMLEVINTMYPIRKIYRE